MKNLLLSIRVSLIVTGLLIVGFACLPGSIGGALFAGIAFGSAFACVALPIGWLADIASVVKAYKEQP